MMDLQELIHLFSKLPTIESPCLSLLKIRNTLRDGTTYYCRQVTINPLQELADWIQEISERYTRGKLSMATKYKQVVPYDGTNIGDYIYFLDNNDPLITSSYQLLSRAIAQPDREIKPIESEYQASVLSAQFSDNYDNHSIALISMRKPVSIFKHKFMGADGTYTPINQPILTLRNAIDVVFFDNQIYMLNMAGENLFHMQRAYHRICAQKAQQVCNSRIIDNPQMFKSVSRKGHNPRSFVSFKDDNLLALNDRKMRKSISKKFDIPLDNNGQFKIDSEEAAQHLIKVLCGKGMINPIDKSPREVPGSQGWK